MIFSYLELKRLAKLPKNTSVDAMSKAITDIGFEVDDVQKFTDIEGIKFGKILKVYKNPEADRLSVCKIQFDDKLRTIQTTADTVKENQVVIAFVPGSKLNGKTFEAKEFKGIVSEGMLSTPSEFGIDKTLCRAEVNAGIVVYKEITDLSIDPIEYLALDDYIIEVDILSNRSDANSYYVMAMELAAKFNTTVDIPNIKESNVDSNLSIKGSEIVAFEAKNDFEVSIKEQILLSKHGIKSINDATDITNLSLIYSGQPTHAYDGEKVGTNFEVGTYSGGVEVFGQKEVTLERDQVVLIDNKPVCVASVIGFEGFCVSKETKTLKIELGIFNNAKVRKAIKSVKLNPLAAIQGSKNLSQGTTRLALAYLTNKLNSFSKPINLTDLEKVSFKYDQELINNYAGEDISQLERFKGAIESLKILGFKFKDGSIIVPNYRHDVESMEDIAEEIFRFYGYDNFKPSKKLVEPLKINKVKNYLTPFINSGYQEVKLYTLISKDRNVFKPFKFKQALSLATYVSKEREVIRDSQAESLQEVAEYNFKRGIKEFSFVSLGMISNTEKTIALINNINNFNEIKQKILEVVPGATFKKIEADSKEFHPNVTAYIVLKNEIIGWMGKIHPRLQKVDAWIAEIMVSKISNRHVKFAEYSESPLKYEDITFSLEKHQKLEDVMPELPEAYEVKVIDEYLDKDILKVTIRITK